MEDISIDSTYGVIIIQDELKAVYVDQNYARIFGYDSPDELLNNIDSFLDLIAPKFHEIAQKNYKDTLSGKMIPRAHTFTNVDRNNKEFTIFSIDHVIEWQGKPALQVTILDLSMLVEANKQLKQSHKNYRNLILHSTQAIILHRDFKPLLVNKAWVRLMRAESVDFVLAQESIMDRIPENRKKSAFTRTQDIMTGKVEQTKSTIIECLCYDGEKRFFNVYDSLIDWGGMPAVQSFVEDVTEKVLLEKELLYKATHDQLSDLLNRSAIYDWLDAHYLVNKSMSCLLIDIDDFKSINDNYGHHKGDQVIGYFSRILKEILADKGVACRWGGEEFIAFLPEISNDDVMAICDQIRSRFAGHCFFSHKDKFTSTVSVGVSYSQGRQECDIEKVITAADVLLYQAKKSGKNKIQCL